MDAQVIQTIIVALLSGGLVSFIEFLIRRNDEKKDKNSEILGAIRELDTKIVILDKKIDSVDQKGDERNAIQSRVRILRFRDEMLEGKNHSHEAFQQVMSDIDEYEYYCSIENPDFKNNQTAATVEYIKKNYAERLEKHDFL